MSEKKKKGGCFKILIKGVLGLLVICVFVAIVSDPVSEKPKANIAEKNIDHEVIKVIPYDASEQNGEARKEIFKELLRAEWKATAAAEEMFPVAKPNSPGYDKSEAMSMLDQQIDKQRSLLLEYRKAITEQYSVSSKDLSDIAMEGVENSWPRPKRP